MEPILEVNGALMAKEGMPSLPVVEDADVFVDCETCAVESRVLPATVRDAGTISDRPHAPGARTPLDRIRFSPGRGTKAVSQATNCSGERGLVGLAEAGEFAFGLPRLNGLNSGVTEALVASEGADT